MQVAELPAPAHEVELLLLCARTQLSPEEHARIDSLLAEELNWPVLVRCAMKHGLTALLYRHLSRSFSGRIPPDIRAQLHEYASRIAIRSMAQTQELLRIVALMESAGIEVLPFKGPMLAAGAYGDIALRSFGDLDILIRRDRFADVKALLARAGYEPYRQMDDRKEAAFLKTQMGYEFVHRDSEIVIEVHWAFLNRVHAFRMKPEMIWPRTRTQQIAGTPVLSLSDEDLLIYLCAHGAKSFWERIIWICDVAELVRQDGRMDWSYVLEQTSRLHGERIVFSGLCLAHDLLAARLPEAVQERMGDQSAAVRLATRIGTRLLTAPDAPLTPREKVRDHLEMRERLLDRLPYYLHLVSVFFKGLFEPQG